MKCVVNIPAQTWTGLSGCELRMSCCGRRLQEVTLFVFRAAAGHEETFKIQMKATGCETLFVWSARDLPLPDSEKLVLRV